jgi:hypothetical protein
MNPYIKFICITILIIFSFSLTAQTLTGTWVGNYGKVSLFNNPTLLIVEIAVTNDSIINGLSHLYYHNNKYEHHKITGKIYLKDSIVIFEESFIETNIKFASIIELRYKLKLISSNNTLRLEGRWKGTESFLGYLSIHKVWLEKKQDTILKKQIFVDSSTKHKVDTVDKKLVRITDVQKLIEVSKTETDSIKISVYDNGVVDGDSISVYKNDSAVFINKPISTNPIVFYLSLDKNIQLQKIKMIAENMGSIPPNTALMIIETAKKRYEVHLSSNFEKNASIEFFLLD